MNVTVFSMLLSFLKMKSNNSHLLVNFQKNTRNCNLFDKNQNEYVRICSKTKHGNATFENRNQKRDMYYILCSSHFETHFVHFEQ